MKVDIIPCLSDNYAYILVGEGNRSAVVVDPSEGAPILTRLRDLGLDLLGIFCTHHHADHVGGLGKLLRAYPKARVFAHERDENRIEGVTDGVRHDEVVQLAGHCFRALHVPGHTLGSVFWIVQDRVFTGDTVFLSGCGRLFEGSAEMMFASLERVLGRLEATFQVYCGHEYTLSNLRFAHHVEPFNPRVREALHDVQGKRARGEVTVPSSWGKELLVNPFLRCSEPAVIEFARRNGAEGVDPVSVFTALRRSKDEL